MNEKIETQGKSVDDAINEALLRLGARRDEVDVTVLDEPKGGFLGLIGGRPAKVEVTRKRSRRRGQRRDNKPGEGHDFGEGSGSSRKSRNNRNNRGGQRRSNNDRNDQSRDHAAASGDDQGGAKKQNQNDSQQRRQGRTRNSDSNNDRNNSRNNNRNKGRDNDRSNDRSSGRNNDGNNDRKNPRSNSRDDNRANSRNTERSNTPNSDQVESRSGKRSENRPETSNGRRPRNQRGNIQKRETRETRPVQVQEQPAAAPVPQQEVPVVEAKRPRSIRRERPARKKPAAAKTTTAQPHEIEAPLELTPLRQGPQGGNDSQPRDDYQSQNASRPVDTNHSTDANHSTDEGQSQQESFSQPDRQPRSRRPERGGRNDRYNQSDYNEPRAARVLNSAPDEIIATGISAGKYAKPIRDIDLEKLNDTLNEITTGLLARAGFPAECDVSDGEYRQVRVTTGDESAGMLIGRHGATIDSVEHLVERMVSNAAGDRVRMNLDINEYRTRRHESLLERVEDAVTQIRESGKTYHVEPMNARERRIVHLAVEEYSDMRTFTMDSHRGRHVVIALDRGENDETVSNDTQDGNHESPEMDDRV